MNLTYSLNTDALYISLAPGRKSAACYQLHQDWILDVEAGGRVLGLEVLQASTFLPRRELLVLDPPPRRQATTGCASMTGRLAELAAAIEVSQLGARRGQRKWRAADAIHRFLEETAVRPSARAARARGVPAKEKPQ